MKTFNIEKFSPKKAELTTLAMKYKNLKIEGIDDKTGFKIVDEARKDLKKKRVEIVKTGKELRQEARDFANAVIKAEKELVAIIEPLEKDLQNKQDKIKEEQLKIDRAVLLPERKEKLASINCIEKTDDDLLMMNPEEFNVFYNNKKAEYLEEKEAQLEIEKARIAKEKEDAAAEKKRLADLEKAKEEARIAAEEKAKQDLIDAKKKAEDDKKKAIEDEKRRAKEERQRLIDDQKRKEEERIAEENRLKAEKEAKAKADAEEKAKMEKRRAFVKWLSDNGYNEKTKDDFYRLDGVEECILYKKISTFKI